MQKIYNLIGLLLLLSPGIRLTPEAEAALFDFLAETLRWVLRLFQ